jgi:Holliday junction resolvase RusA-like endonuclease
MTLVITFTGDPVAKGRARMSIAGGRPIAYTPAKTRKYESALAYAAREAMGDRLRFLGAVRVDIVASLPVPKSWSKKKRAHALAGEIFPTSRPDLDNYEKSALDALNCVVFNDDSQVVKKTSEKVYSDKPSLRIEVTSLDLEG